MLVYFLNCDRLVSRKSRCENIFTAASQPLHVVWMNPKASFVWAQKENCFPAGTKKSFMRKSARTLSTIMRKNFVPAKIRFLQFSRIFIVDEAKKPLESLAKNYFKSKSEIWVELRFTRNPRHRRTILSGRRKELQMWKCQNKNPRWRRKEISVSESFTNARCERRNLLKLSP